MSRGSDDDAAARRSAMRKIMAEVRDAGMDAAALEAQVAQALATLTDRELAAIRPWLEEMDDLISNLRNSA